MRVLVPKGSSPNRKCARALVMSVVLLSDAASAPNLQQQLAASCTVLGIHRPSDMNRSYNLLAFPHGAYLIRLKKKKEGGMGHHRG